MKPRGAEHEALELEIARHWSVTREARVEDAMPAFLANPLIADQIGRNSNVVVQVLDMQRFKSVYVSPNVFEVCGYTQEENNARGVVQWLRNLTLRELAFQVRNARLIGKVQKTLPPRSGFRSAMINSGMRCKDGRRLRIVSQNFTIEWDAKGRQTYQLFLWRDATHLFKDENVVVRHEWSSPDAGAPVVWTYDAEKAKFSEQDLFSAREREVLALVREGLTSKEIGAALGISPSTVENHRKNAIQRMQVKSTEGLLEIGAWLRLL